MLPKPLIFLFALFAAAIGRAQVADFSMSRKGGCAPLTVYFNDLSTGAPGSYSWVLGNSVTANTPNASTVYTTPGTYIVSLTVGGAAGPSTKTDTVVVYGGPTVSFSAASLAGCTPHAVPFSSSITPNAPGGLSYSWAFGDGTNDTAANPNHVYASPGIHTVSLTVTNGAGCSSTAVRNSYVTAWAVPQLSFTADKSLHCGAPVTVNFSATASGGLGPYLISWDFGDNTSAAPGPSPTASHVYSGGTYTVRSIVADSRGCRDTELIPNYIFVMGTRPSFTARNACVDSAITFTNTTGAGSTAVWNFADGSQDTGDVRQHIFQYPGTYSVTMSVTIGGCVNKTALQQITAYPKANSTIAFLPAVPCEAPQTLTFTASSTVPATYEWSWLSGGTASGPTATKHYARNTADVVVLKSTTANGCTSVASMDTLMIRDLHHKIISQTETGVDLDSLHGGCAPFTARFGNMIPRSTPPFPSVYPAAITGYNWISATDRDPGRRGRSIFT